MTGRRDHLRGLLNGFEPGDAAEAGHLQRMRSLLETSGDPFSRSHFDPGHFTASAFILSPDGGSLLFILHGKLHRWLQPGGHVDPEDRDILSAARREVAEEVGIDASALAPAEGVFDVDVHPIPAMRGEPAHEHFDVRFLFRAPDAEFAVGSDARAARWFALEDVDAQRADASVVRAAAKLSWRGRRWVGGGRAGI